MRSTKSVLVAGSLAIVVVAFGACGGGGNSGGSAGSGGSSGSDSGLGGGEGGHTFGDDGPSGNPAPTCDAGCPTGTTCDFGVCLPPQSACVTNGDCEDDTYCQASQCVPYGSPPSNTKNDPSCSQVVPPGAFAPTVLCEFTAAPMGDPFPMHLDVQATPIVVNFDKVLEGTAAIPSIVVPFTATVPGSYTETLGIVRILKGSDCTLQANLGGVDLDGDGNVDWVNSPSSVAVADLNGDGVPEIVAYMGDRTTVAFTRTGTNTWKPLWPKVKATLADGVTPFVCMDDGTYGAAPGSSTTLDVWSGPSIHDVDNDGVPEVIREGYVIEGTTGIVRAQPPTDYASYYLGILPVLADIYNDGKAALTNGAHIWEFDGTNNLWVEQKGFETMTSTPPGWVGLADFNPYDGKTSPEIVVATGAEAAGGGTMTIYSLDHSVFMNMTVAVPGTGGGPPTIADYDHDGLPEVGLAGKDYYTVFDPDCQGTPRTGGKCADRTHCDFGTAGACPDYILWSKKTQDHSSDITGSSVFDFPGAGTPEVVYADECFARVFSGFDGSVLFSQYHSSCTWLENPVVADVSGDFHSEIVVPSNLACGAGTAGIDCSGSLDANGVDAAFVGAQCQADTDCISGSCVSGYCRCTTSAQCCTLNDDTQCVEAGTQCAPPPTGTPGTGNTCRAPHPHGLQGIRVYKDAKDRWVQSRQIWSQHAYAVTHISENGVVPKTSQWASNWTTAGLNNFRQNVPGEGSGNPIGDVTAQAGPFFTCSGGQAVFHEPICNRGTAPLGAGVPVGFYTNGAKVCSATTTTALDVGQCENVSCTWAGTPTSQGAEVNVTVIADDGETTAECDPTNDKGVVENVFCLPPQ